MSVSKEYIEYIEDLLCDFPELTTKSFFGGKSLRSSLHGLDTQFAMMLNDTLYFVVDDETRPKYQSRGMKSFQYEKKTGTVFVEKYYTAPEECFEDQELMLEWAHEALATANRIK